jgi:hypothetical protein
VENLLEDFLGRLQLEKPVVDFLPGSKVLALVSTIYHEKTSRVVWLISAFGNVLATSFGDAPGPSSK